MEFLNLLFDSKGDQEEEEIETSEFDGDVRA